MPLNVEFYNDATLNILGIDFKNTSPYTEVNPYSPIFQINAFEGQ